MTPAPVPSLRHLRALTDDRGLAEHAAGADPRHDLGYCTDDAGRLLALAVNLSEDPDAYELADRAMAFLEAAFAGDRGFRLRRRSDRSWTEDPPSDDATGRALQGLGAAAGVAPWDDIHRRACILYAKAHSFASAHPRAVAYAGIGAASIAEHTTPPAGTLATLRQTARLLEGAPRDGPWRWPWPRLTYANALLPAAQLRAGAVFGDREAIERALEVLDWLVGLEGVEDEFSPTPVGGRGPGDPVGRFDQQPIEAACMADASATAYRVTGDQSWHGRMVLSARWFLGRNDLGIDVHDPTTGGGYDGLTRGGVNENQGAESTIAFVATMIRLADASADQLANDVEAAR